MNSSSTQSRNSACASFVSTTPLLARNWAVFASSATTGRIPARTSGSRVHSRSFQGFSRTSVDA